MLTPKDIKVIREIIQFEISKQTQIGYATASPTDGFASPHTMKFTVVPPATATVMSDDQINEYWSNQTKPTPPNPPPHPEGHTPVA